MEEPKDFISWIGIVPDPRIVGMVTYPLGEILLVALVGTLCRMEDWDEIVYFAEEQLEWLRRFLPFGNGIASAKTFRTVFRALDHGAFSEAFTAWVSEWGGRGVIAIDGKTLRGSKDGEAGKAQHVLNAFAHESGLVLGQQPVDGKSNEITAIPAFLERPRPGRRHRHHGRHGSPEEHRRAHRGEEGGLHPGAQRQPGLVV